MARLLGRAFAIVEPTLKHLRFAAFALSLALIGFFACSQAAGQPSDPAKPDADTARREKVQEHVRRARRLIDFGRPLLAKKQLDLALGLDAANRDVLLWQLRLFTRSSGGADDAKKWAAALARSFADDYEACFEIANYLFITQADLRGPNPTKPEEVKAALERLKVEMEVYNALADYVVEPGDKLPEAASAKSDLSLAWLARASKQTPKTGEVASLAAQELDFRARRFLSFSRLDSTLRSFGDAAMKLSERAAPLFRRVHQSDPADMLSRAALCGVLFRLGKHEEARRECESVLLVSGEDAPVSNKVMFILIDVAAALGDLDLLIANLERRDRIFNDIDSALDLSAARRIRDQKWSLERWREYRLVYDLRGDARMQGCGELLAAQPDFAEVHLLAAEAMIARAEMLRNEPEVRNSWYEGAIKAVDQAGDLGVKLADAARLKALALWHLGRFKEAGACFEQTAKLDPDDDFARRYARASVDIDAKRYTVEDYMIMLGLQREGDFKAQRSLLESLTKRAPKFFDAWLMLGEVSYLLSMHEDALEAYTHALELGPDNLASLYGAGFSALYLGKFDIALKHWDNLNALKPDYKGTARWRRIVGSAKAKEGSARKKAIMFWLGGSTPTDSASTRLDNLEKAVAADPTFSEAAIDLARLLREEAPKNPERGPLMVARAERLLASAHENAQDDAARGAARLELGRVRIALKKYETAAEDFESSFALSPGDGTALLMAALARRANGDEAGASGDMRKLYAEVPGTLLVRPSGQVLTLLDLRPVAVQGPKYVTPAWALGEKLKYGVAISAEGEGGEIGRHTVNWGFEMHVEVASTPELSGTWKLIVTFAPEAGAAAVPELEGLRLQVEISPWFGLVRNPLPENRRLADAVDPAITALCEALCIGLGESPIVQFYGWRNERTQGPAHFNDDTSAEAAIIEQLVGDTTVIKRVSAKGRHAGGDPEYVNEGGRVEARSELVGNKRTLRKVSVTIENESLAKTDDDVISSKLSVTLQAR